MVGVCVNRNLGDCCGALDVVQELRKAEGGEARRDLAGQKFSSEIGIQSDRPRVESHQTIER
jgi:hypothetical protein